MELEDAYNEYTNVSGYKSLRDRSSDSKSKRWKSRGLSTDSYQQVYSPVRTLNAVEVDLLKTQNKHLKQKVNNLKSNVEQVSNHKLIRENTIKAKRL